VNDTIDTYYQIDEEPIEALTDEIVEQPPLMYVKSMPYFDSCKDSTGIQREKCTKEKMHTLIKENFILPKDAKEKGLEGTAYVQFIVNIKGEVTNPELLRSTSHPILDKAAIESIMKLPKFNPGISMGKLVSIIYIIPVKANFK
jgi:TonB family protein